MCSLLKNGKVTVMPMTIKNVQPLPRDSRGRFVKRPTITNNNECLQVRLASKPRGHPVDSKLQNTNTVTRLASLPRSSWKCLRWLLCFFWCCVVRYAVVYLGWAAIGGSNLRRDRVSNFLFQNRNVSGWR